MSSTVLLVDAEREVRAIIERNQDSAHWTIVQVGDADQALQLVKEQVPSLIVVNVDIAKGWPLCTHLKRGHTSIPVIVVSFRLGKEVFNNHQKLDTRADAYHRLPEELDGLEISLGYFSSHKSETGHDDEDSSPSRPRHRRAGSVQVPSGVVQRLESTVAEQARALEDARRQIEALEVERDAVADKNRRQMLELMTVAPAPADAAETGALKERIATLETEVLMSSRREDELREMRFAIAQKIGDVEKAVAERGAVEMQVKKAALALDEARHSEERTRQALEAQVASLRAEKAQLAQRMSELEETNRSVPGAVNQAVEQAREAARREAHEAAEQLSRASVQLSTLAIELSQAHQARLQAEMDKDLFEERMTAAELQLGQALQRAESAESAWAVVNARVEQLQGALTGRQVEVDAAIAEKKSTAEALATSRRLMREYATDAARKAEELKVTSERQKELEAAATAYESAKEELTQALEFEKSLVESLERDLAAARATPVPSPMEVVEIEGLRERVAQLEAGLQAEKARGEAELSRAIEKAAADVAAAKAKAEEISRDDFETMRLVMQAEMDDARGAAERDVAAVKAQAQTDIEAMRAQLDNEQRQAGTALASERQALASHVTTVHQRFEALVTYARALEARLSEAEARRGAVLTKLEALVDDVRHQAPAGENPPPMDLPSAPTIATE